MPEAATPPAGNAPDASGAAAAGSTGQTTTPPAGTPPPAGTTPAAGATGQTQPGAPAAGQPPAGETKPLELVVPKDSPLPKEHVDAIKAFAVEKKLPADVAQALLDRDHAQVVAQNAKWADDVKTFEAQVRADPELGGQNYDKSIALATKALKQFGRPSLIKVLNDTGLGSYPDFIHLMAAVGKVLGEDGHTSAAPAASAGPKSLADVLYAPEKRA